jgi:hypothetical protein
VYIEAGGLLGRCTYIIHVSFMNSKNKTETQVIIPSPARAEIILTEVFHGFPQSIQANVRIISSIRQRSVPFTSVPIHYSLMNLQFEAIHSELLSAARNHNR